MDGAATIYSPEPPRHWQQHPLTRLAAAVIGSGSIYLYLWSTGSSPDESEAGTWGVPSLVQAIIFYGGGFTLWLWLVLRFMCGQRLSDLNLRPGGLGKDMLIGVLAFVGLVFLMGLVQSIVLTFVPEPELSESMEQAYGAIYADPWVLFIMAGPYSWLAAGLMEEFNRVFFLSRLWGVFPSWLGKAAAILLAALFFGLYHAYQGTAAVISLGVMGVAFGVLYLWQGRALPLIIAHAMYSSYATLYGWVWWSYYGATSTAAV